MKQAITANLKMKNEGWSITPVLMMPPLTDIHTQAFLGSWSWTMPHEKRRLLLTSAARDLDGLLVSPSAVAREYLSIKYDGVKLRMTGNQAEQITIPRYHPLFAMPAQVENAIYLDLKSAFWQIINVVGWDCDYNPSRWLAVRSRVNDFPFPDWKFARNCLVSLARPSMINIWDGSQIKSAPKRNPHVNYHITALVYDVLHGIAQDMIEAGALYVHTDGYILPESREADAQAILLSWGLVGAVKDRGRMEVIAAGVYRSPRHKPAGHHTLARPAQINNLKSVNRAWLRKRFRHFAETV